VASKILIRFAVPRDVDRMVSDGVVGGPLPSGQSWPERMSFWLREQRAGRRLILVAEEGRAIVATVQIVFALPAGYSDPEAVNGTDVAMMELLRTGKGARKAVVERLIQEVQDVARKRGVKTLTFCLSIDHDAALSQVKAWGFEEFRIMPEKRGTLAFFRKSI
jgi:hypothetical protein